MAMNKAADFKVFQASAGAGKTFTLIKEYLKLCLKEEGTVAHFKNILAITFTNAAANEMKAKIVNTLCEIIESKALDPHSMEAKLVEELEISDAELKRNAHSLMTCIMHDYSSFCVSTIDAFVQKLSRSFAHDLGLPNQYTVSIDTDEIAEVITQNIGLRLSDQSDYLTRLLIDFSNNQFDNQRSTAIESQLSDFVKKLMTEKAYQKDENNTIQNAQQYRQALDFLNARTYPFEQKIKAFVDDFKAIEGRYGLCDTSYSYGKNGFISFIRKLSNRIYEKPNTRFNTMLEKGNCFSTEAEKKMGKSQTEAINLELLPILKALDDYYEKALGPFLFYRSQRDLLYLYALRTQIRMEFALLAEEDEVVHISEFNKLLNTVMGDFSVPFVYERIGEHFRHVFVDEFQDTSVLQWQNLLPLVDNGLSSGHTSMVVGDGKQSIYRFRSGEVEQIVNLPNIYALPEDERKASFEQYQSNLKSHFYFKNLDTNYRSFANVVDFNNAFFEFAHQRLAPESQKVYKAEKPGTEEGVCIIQKKAKKEKGLVQVELYDPENQPEYCFERVEAVIRELTECHGYQFGDITLLTRKSDYGSELANYLNDKGVPVISQVSILLKSSDKVQLLVNTLRYMIYDDQEPYIANLLYYWRLVQQPDFEGDISGWFDSVKGVAQGETAIESAMGLNKPGLLKETLSKATCLYDLCAALIRLYHFDTIRDAFLNYFMEEVYKWQSGPIEGIADFLAHWDKKQDVLSVKSVSGNAVKIMTIHKSKGLEFPVVIYPEAIIDLDERLNASKSPEAWLAPQDLGYEAIPNLEKVLFKMDKTAEYMGELALRQVEKEKESNRLDNLNLLYVAFTRAVQRLYVIAKKGKADKPNILRDFLEESNQVMAKEENGAWVYRFGSPDFRNPNETESDGDSSVLTESTASDWFHRVSVDPNPTMIWKTTNEKLLPREFGELVHQVLAKVRTSNEIEAVLQPYLNDGTINQDTSTWIRERFLQMTQHPQIAPAYDPTVKVKTECELLHNGSVLRLDRYAELVDVIYIIDYKTGKREEAHQKQIRTYSEALKEMTDKEIRAYLVYLTEDTIEVDKL